MCAYWLGATSCALLSTPAQRVSPGTHFKCCSGKLVVTHTKLLILCMGLVRSPYLFILERG